jgi:hypothetical protein
MLLVLESIIQEFSSFKVEFSTKSIKKGSPFEKDIGPGIKINSYSSINEYDKRCKGFVESVKIEVDDFIASEKNKLNVILILEEKLIILKTFIQTYMPDDINLILFGIDYKIPSHYSDIFANGLKEKISYFVQLSRELINTLVEFIRQKLRLVKKVIKMEGNTQYQIPFPESNSTDFRKSIKDNYPKMEWARSDMDLIELIISMHESGCIKSHSGEFTQTMAIQVAEEIFNRTIKDSGVKIHKAGARVKSAAPFLEELLESYLKRLKRLDFEKQSNR